MRARGLGIVVSMAAALSGCGSSNSAAGAGGSGGDGDGMAGASGGSAAGGATATAGRGGSGGTAASAGSGGSGGKAHVQLVLGVDPPKTGMFTDDRDNNQYGWVEINGVKWMSENLRFVLGKQDLQTCFYDGTSAGEDCAVAGYFYGWSAAMAQPRIADSLLLGVTDGTYQGICPAGWHLPTGAEWLALFDYVNTLAKKGPPQQIGDIRYRDISDPLLSAMGWKGGYGTNELGFNAKPYGEHAIGNTTSFWASDESNRQFATMVDLTGTVATVDTDLKAYRQAVRCIEGAASKPAPVAMGPALTNTTSTFTDRRDQKAYATVTVGTQEWFAQNLNYTPSTGDSVCYAEQAEMCRIFGRLYGYDTAQTICPSGFHLPSVEEWHTLATYVDDNSGKAGSKQDQGSFTWTIGKQLLAPWDVWQGGPSDPPSFGFNGLPGGFALDDDQSGSYEDEALFWTAKGATSDQVAVTLNTTYLTTSPVTTGVEAYVRCLRD